jgi:hypothetical protein
MPSAETCIVYCKEGEQEKDDKLLKLKKNKSLFRKSKLAFFRGY